MSRFYVLSANGSAVLTHDPRNRGLQTKNKIQCYFLTMLLIIIIPPHPSQTKSNSHLIPYVDKLPYEAYSQLLHPLYARLSNGQQ